jgi:uncharacterized peroxidase-related enzyme
MFIAAPDESADTARIYKATSDAQGFVMNLAKAWAWRPDVFEGFASLRNLLTSQSSLTKRDQAVLVCAMASRLGDAYCSLAWGKMLSQEAGASLAAAVIRNTADAALTDRDRAMADWARKVAGNPNGTEAPDVNALRAVGLDDRAIFEATVFVAFRLAFSTVNDAMGIAPDWQLAESVPGQVRAAVSYGRAVAPRQP